MERRFKVSFTITDKDALVPEREAIDVIRDVVTRNLIMEGDGPVNGFEADEVSDLTIERIRP